MMSFLVWIGSLALWLGIVFATRGIYDRIINKLCHLFIYIFDESGEKVLDEIIAESKRAVRNGGDK